MKKNVINNTAGSADNCAAGSKTHNAMNHAAVSAKKMRLRVRLFAGMLAAVLFAGTVLMPVKASGTAGLSGTQESSSDAGSILFEQNGDGEAVSGEEIGKTQLVYIKEALNELREMGFTPDVVLGEVKALVLSFLGSKSEQETGEESLTGEPGIAAAEPIPEEETEIASDEQIPGDTEEDLKSASDSDTMEESSDGSLQGTLQEAAEQVKEDAGEYISGKVDEAKEQAEETAKEKAVGAVESLFDSLFQ